MTALAIGPGWRPAGQSGTNGLPRAAPAPTTGVRRLQQAHRRDVVRHVALVSVGFLLVLITGVWFVASEIPRLRLATVRRVVAGTLLAVTGLLLIIATHRATPASWRGVCSAP